MSFIRSRRMSGATFAAAMCLLSVAFAASAQSSSGPYTDAENRLSGDDEVEAWYGGMHKLRRDFDQICGDTFCEGDYSNIYALRLRCSVVAASGLLGRCVWVFAASSEEIDPARGRIVVQPKIWRCVLPLAPKTSLSSLLAVLAQERPLYAPLPNSSRSIYDGLSDCL